MPSISEVCLPIIVEEGGHLHLININIRQPDCPSLRIEDFPYADGSSITECSSDAIDRDRSLAGELVSEISVSDMVVINMSGDLSLFGCSQDVLDAAASHSVPVLLVFNNRERSLPYRGLFTGTDGEWELLVDLLVAGGRMNVESFLKWCSNRFDGTEYEVSGPVPLPAQGCYAPGSYILDIDEVLRGLDDSRPIVGIFFSQRKWAAGKTRHIDALMNRISESGGTPVAFFITYRCMESIGSIGMGGLIDDHILADGVPRFGCFINTVSSAITIESRGSPGGRGAGFLERLGVPVLHSPVLSSTEDDWREGFRGLTNSEIVYDAAFPEFDGQIITVPCASTVPDPDGIRNYIPIDERVDRLADIAMMWASLDRKPNGERKVAIVFYMYPPSDSHAGSAADLDTFASVRDLLARMSEEGYTLDWVPETSQELVDRIFEGITNDTESSDDNRLRRDSLDLIDGDTYNGWFSELSEAQRDFITRDWGQPPGDVLTVDGCIAVPGIRNGNVVLSFQPSRGRDIQATYHNHNCSIPHQYHSFYKWLRRSFGADAVIHVGTHGTLEWLPGKAVALSGDCSPDFVLDSIPNIYPYVIGNPGEGTQAKRRSYAVLVDHMIPAMVRSGGYSELDELEGIVQSYMRDSQSNRSDHLEGIVDTLFDKVRQMDLLDDLGLPKDATREQVIDMVDEIYDYVVELKGNMIKDGFHILGRVPEGELMDEMVYSLTRNRNGDVPSLPSCVASVRGYDYDSLRDDPSGSDPDTGDLNGVILESIEEESFDIIRAMGSVGYDPEESRMYVGGRYPDHSQLDPTVDLILDSIHPNILRISEEMDSMMDAMKGRYIRPGPSGCPTRGRADLLPTGRNFYSLDPESVPTHPSWDIGRKMADQLIQRYLDENGAYPGSVGITLWATDTMKTGGDDVAYVLWLLGVRPVWSGYGNRVTGLEVVPLEELGRPRVDVTVNISGLFRDTFPNITEMIEDAVLRVSSLDEDDEDNAIRRHMKADVADMVSKGIPEDEARRNAGYRIFSNTPGQYGMGVNNLITASCWKDRDDLGSYYCEAGCYVYGKDVYGDRAFDLYRRRLSGVQITVKNSTSREYDLFDNDDVFQYLGGMNSAVEWASGGRKPMSVIGCSADVDRLVLRTVEEESRYVFRSKVVNPKYEQGLRRHGFRGATEVLKMFEYIFGWDATSDVIGDWMYTRLAEYYILDDEVNSWIRECNPHAARDMIDVLMEAYGRGMWDAPEDVLQGLRERYLQAEELIEELSDR